MKPRDISCCALVWGFSLGGSFACSAERPDNEATPGIGGQSGLPSASPTADASSEEDSGSDSQDESEGSASGSSSNQEGSSGQSDDDPEESDDGDSGDDDGPGIQFDVLPIPDGGPGDDRGCAIDFLFVIDDSGSMADEQLNLAASVPEFVQTVKNEIENLDSFHVGVVASEPYFANIPECREMGGLIVQTAGENSSATNCGPYASGKNYMTAADDLDLTFPCAAKPGTSGDGNERSFDALSRALDPVMTGPGKCNEGFLRDNAVLVVTVITDEEDDHADQDENGNNGSAGEPQDWYNAVLAAKMGRPEYLVGLSLIGIEEPNECAVTQPTGQGGSIGDDGAEISPRVRAFTELFGDHGVVGDVCAPNYDPFFENAVSLIQLACDSIPEG